MQGVGAGEAKCLVEEWGVQRLFCIHKLAHRSMVWSKVAHIHSLLFPSVKDKT